MKKDKILMISLITIILFNVFFMIMLIYYNDIIILPIKFIKNVTKEYYFWYMDVRAPVPNEAIIIGISGILKMMFSLILSLEFFYIIFNKKYINIIGKKNVAIFLIIGFIINCLSFLFIKYKAENYRLFMTLISTEILSLILLNLVLKIKKEVFNLSYHS